jgi:hypothetical protein
MKSEETTPAFTKMEGELKKEAIVTRSISWKHIFIFVLGKYNHLFFYPLRKITRCGGSKEKPIGDHDLLKPKSSFFNMIYVYGFFTSWIFSILVVGILY